MSSSKLYGCVSSTRSGFDQVCFVYFHSTICDNILGCHKGTFSIASPSFDLVYGSIATRFVFDLLVLLEAASLQYRK